MPTREDHTIFRRAAEADRETIRDLLTLVKLPTESLEKNSSTFYVGQTDKSIDVVAAYEYYERDALLRSVAVRPELQKRGLGDSIVDFMISTARAQGIRRIVLLTETAQLFFEKKGFKVVDRSSIVNEPMKRSSEFTYACPTSAVCMMLNLS